MIVIQTYYRHRDDASRVTYKDYYATSGLKAEMSIINEDKRHHDLAKYEPITIYNVFDTDEE